MQKCGIDPRRESAHIRTCQLGHPHPRAGDREPSGCRPPPPPPPAPPRPPPPGAGAREPSGCRPPPQPTTGQADNTTEESSLMVQMAQAPAKAPVVVDVSWDPITTTFGDQRP